MEKERVPINVQDLMFSAGVDSCNTFASFVEDEAEEAGGVTLETSHTIETS